MEDIMIANYARHRKLRSLSPRDGCRSPLSPVNNYFTPGQANKTRSDRNRLNIPDCYPDRYPTTPTELRLLSDSFGNEALKSPRLCRVKSLKVDTPDRAAILANGRVPSDAASVLGTGAFGTVFSGKYHGKEVAVKVIVRPDTEPKSPTTSLDGELNALYLSHRNVVKILRIDQKVDRGLSLIIMEHAGRTLQKIIEDPSDTLDFLTCVDFAHQIASGMSYVHSMEILHLDIKPANILVNKDLVCKITDFGASVSLERLESMQRLKPRGTVAYCAPEVFRGQIPSDRSDIYSFGVLLWQLWTREMPYRGIAKDRIIYMVVAQGKRPHDCSHVSREMHDEYSLIYSQCVESSSLMRPSAIEVTKLLSVLNSRAQC